jgi:hypothetical protein
MPFSREEMAYYLNESGWKVNHFDIVAALGLTITLAGELLMNRITSEELYKQYAETLVNQALQFESLLCETFASVQSLPDRTWYFAMWNCE